MRRPLIWLIIATLSMPVYADPGRGHWSGGQGRGGRGGFDWIGLALFGAITSLIFFTEQSRPPPPAPQPVTPRYIEAPREESPPAAPANTWYYCGSSAKYYPDTQACPEGWQAVPSTPQ